MRRLLPSGPPGRPGSVRIAHGTPPGIPGTFDGLQSLSACADGRRLTALLAPLQAVRHRVLPQQGLPGFLESLLYRAPNLATASMLTEVGE